MPDNEVGEVEMHTLAAFDAALAEASKRPYDEVCKELELLRDRARKNASTLEAYRRLTPRARQLLDVIQEGIDIAGAALRLQTAVDEIERMEAGQ